MRPIEFRAWDKKAKVMVYPVVVYETQDHVGFSEETFRRCYDQNEWYEHLEVGDDWYYLFDNRGVMQYTGLQDANGQKAFENDLIKNSAGILMVVYWDNEASAFFKKLPHHVGNEYAVGIRNMEYWRVIGNIYQNKELLNEVKK